MFYLNKGVYVNVLYYSGYILISYFLSMALKSASRKGTPARAKSEAVRNDEIEPMIILLGLLDIICFFIENL